MPVIPKRILMGPGPSEVSDRVLQALSQPTLGHLDPVFIEIMDDINEHLRFAFLTQNLVTLPISAPGSAGMECCLVNLIEAGDKVLVCQNGVFGTRMAELARRCGAEVILVEDEWGKPVDLGKVESTLNKYPGVSLLAFVHAETSTGVKSDAESLVKLAHRYGALSLVDAVTSLGGIELKVDDWKIDAIYSGSQKCLSAPPGLSPVSLSPMAMEKIKKRRQAPQSWFLDIHLLTSYWGGSSKRAYHHTAPVNALYGLHEALKIFKAEGHQKSWERHQRNHLLLRQGLTDLGLEFFVEEEHRLPQLNAVRVPPGVDEARVRTRLLQEFNLEIGAGLGPMAGKVWRIGLMGASCTADHVALCLSALKKVLS